MRTPEMELQEYSTSFHLEKMYSTVPSSQPITVRAVTVFQSHEVFTLHCTTSVCYSTFGEPRWKREQHPHFLQHTLPVIKSANCNISLGRASIKLIINKSSFKYILL